jgi:hypothetical protein
MGNIFDAALMLVRVFAGMKITTGIILLGVAIFIAELEGPGRSLQILCPRGC